MPLTHSSIATSADVQPFHGYVDTTEDALRLIEAARRGLLPRVTRRLNELERRSMIKSGAVFVFSVEESGIKRWTEGLAWSQSRISGNFLIYREVTDRSTLRTSHQASDVPDTAQATHIADGHVTLKPNGLIKKTITVKINGSDHHLISYFTQEDVRSGRLRRPTSRSDLMALKIPSELLQSANFRYPLKLEGQYVGLLNQSGESIDEGDNRRGGFRSPTPVRLPSRTMPSLAEAGLIPTDISKLSRIQTDTSTMHYPVHNRSGQIDTVYRPRVQQDIHHAAPSPSPVFHGGNMDTQGLPSMSSSWPSSYSSSPEAFSIGTGASTLYQSQLDMGPVHSAPVQRDEAWAEHSPTSSRHARPFDQHVPRLDVGSHTDMNSWTPVAPTMSEPQLQSAPPTTTSISSQYPAGRGREHLRTRSFPPVWPWGDVTSSIYQAPPVSPVYTQHGVHRSPN